MSALNAVRARIAEAILGAPEETTTLRVGSITLRPAQVAALRRVRSAIAEFGGALLADEPGLGKTYVALALAHERGGAHVVAPAALRDMWRDASARAATPVAFTSFETLSRRAGAVTAGCIIIDEAHHCGRRSTRRYGHLARLCAGRAVLLMSATPVRNRGDERAALLELVAGRRAAALDDALLSRIVIRRAAAAGERPLIAPTRWHRLPARADIRALLAALPPPVPPADGIPGTALVAVGLGRSWASSLAALDATLRRRDQRGRAMLDALAAGRMPTRAELARWIVGDDATQLAFPEITSGVSRAAPALSRAMQSHLDGVHALRQAIAGAVDHDARDRAALLRRLRARHAGARLIAFTAFAETATALWRELRRDPGVALLTGRGARTASGARPRRDILRALGGAAPSSARDDVTLAIATDVLSEGVNLQGASVIVHLDMPWTPAALEQRAGRAARIGSPHATVHVHALRAPVGATALLRMGARLRVKRDAQREAVAPAAAAERLRRLALAWRDECVAGSAGGEPSGAHSTVRAAAVAARRRGWVAVTAGAGGALRLQSSRGDSAPSLLALLDSIGSSERPVNDARLAQATRAAQRALERRRSRATAGDSASGARRALLRRIGAIVANAPADRRAATARAAEDVRAALGTAEGAGAEMEIAAISRSAATKPLEWLHAIAERLGTMRRAAPAQTARGADDRPRLVALLLLER